MSEAACLREVGGWVGGGVRGGWNELLWVLGGWVVEKEQTVEMSCCGLWVGCGWVGGWVGGKEGRTKAAWRCFSNGRVSE